MTRIARQAAEKARNQIEDINDYFRRIPDTLKLKQKKPRKTLQNKSPMIEVVISPTPDSTTNCTVAVNMNKEANHSSIPQEDEVRSKTVVVTVPKNAFTPIKQRWDIPNGNASMHRIQDQSNVETCIVRPRVVPPRGQPNFVHEWTPPNVAEARVGHPSGPQPSTIPSGSLSPPALTPLNQQTKVDVAKHIMRLPDFHPLPFYEFIGNVYGPALLLSRPLQPNEYNTNFMLRHRYLSDLQCAEFLRKQTPNFKQIFYVIIRFSLFQNGEYGRDELPKDATVEINHKTFEFKNTNFSIGSKNKQRFLPIDITPYINYNHCQNMIRISWTGELTKVFTCNISFCKKIEVNDCILKMIQHNILPPSVTRNKVINLFAASDEEEVQCSLGYYVTLVCPLSKVRIQTPCRGLRCEHLQCFDANIYLNMNQRAGSWKCPWCNAVVTLQDLIIDGYFLDILSSNLLSENCKEIQFHKNGLWSPVESRPVPVTDSTIKIIEDTDIVDLTED